jgi:hypothetical protein
MPEPVTMAILITTWIVHHIGTVAVVLYTVALTVAALEEWISSRSAIGAADADVIGVELANRLANNNYISMPGVFRKEPLNTRMVQVIYNKRTQQILDSRKIASKVSPSMEVIKRHDAANGMLVYS